MHPRHLLLIVAGAALVSAVQAQPAFPAKPIRILVGAPPGGSNDILARAISQRVSESVGQPVVVENRPGANQMIAADLTAKAPPDGHTLYVTSTSYTTGAALMSKLPFDPVNDLAGITMLGFGPMVLVVHPSLPARNTRELIALLRARPGQLNYTSSGVGGINHLAMEVLKSSAKIDIVHVPHKGMGPALTDLIAGQVQAVIVGLPSVEAHLKTGRLRVIGVSTAKRSAFAPELPPIADAVPGYDVSLWWGIFSAAKTPRPAMERLNAEIHKALSTADVKKRFADFGAEPSPMTPEAFSAHVRGEIAKWGKVVKENQIKAE
ncbi:MAG: tripartite tricarboxylate transporter substrate binding protein [Burkholderiales bacterium]